MSDKTQTTPMEDKDYINEFKFLLQQPLPRREVRQRLHEANKEMMQLAQQRKEEEEEEEDTIKKLARLMMDGIDVEEWRTINKAREMDKHEEK